MDVGGASPPKGPLFEVTEHELGAAHVVAAAGEIDVASAGPLQEAMSAAIDAGHTRLVVDLSNALFIDSTGLAALIGAWRQLSRLDGHLAVVCDNPTMLRVFNITKTDELLEVVPDRAAALQHVTGGDGQDADG
jgi:anti-sigma B factor antagonist